MHYYGNLHRHRPISCYARECERTPDPDSDEGYCEEHARTVLAACITRGQRPHAADQPYYVADDFDALVDGERVHMPEQCGNCGGVVFIARRHGTDRAYSWRLECSGHNYDAAILDELELSPEDRQLMEHGCGARYGIFTEINGKVWS